MFNLKALICIVLIGAVYATEEIPEEQKKTMEILAECEKKWDVSKEDFEKMNQSLAEPSEKILCFMKCTAEKDGTIDENGKLNEQNTDKLIAMMKLEDQDKNKMKECLKNSPVVKTCGDMKYIGKCLSDA